MASVAVFDLSKQYANSIHALHPTTLHADDGELLAIVGPSGCGKTTLFRLIAGLVTPTTGRVLIGDRDVTNLAIYRRDVGMVFQRPALYPHLNVRKNLGFGLDARRAFASFRKDPVRDQRVVDAVQILGLAELLHRMPSELSGGQQQRVALGRAIVRQPAVFLLDEPLSNLDSRLRLEMRRELHLLHKRLGATMLYVTHDQEEALTLGDRVAVLDRGRLQQVDRAAVLYERPANRFVAGFLGWPGMNLLDGQLVWDNDRLALINGTDVFDLGSVRQADWRQFAGRRVTLGIRPEDVRLMPGGDSDARLSLEVYLAETLGPDRLLSLRHGDWTVSMRLEKSLAPLEPTTVTATLALARAHLFDRESGSALSHGRPAG